MFIFNRNNQPNASLLVIPYFLASFVKQKPSPRLAMDHVEFAQFVVRSIGEAFRTGWIWTALVSAVTVGLVAPAVVHWWAVRRETKARSNAIQLTLNSLIAELESLQTHSDANITILTRIHEAGREPTYIELKKMIFSGSGLEFVNSDTFKYIEKSMGKEIMKLSRYIRNTDWQIEDILSRYKNQIPENPDIRGINRLKARFSFEKRVSKELCASVEAFSRSEGRHQHHPSDWGDA